MISYNYIYIYNDGADVAISDLAHSTKPIGQCYARNANGTWAARRRNVYGHQRNAQRHYTMTVL